MSVSCMESAPIRRLRTPVESPVWGWVWAVGGGAFSLLLGLPLLAAAVLLLPWFLLVRRLLLWLHWATHYSEGYPERLSGTEACWLGATWGRSVLHAVLVLEASTASGAALDVGHLQDIVLARVIPAYPRLTAKPVQMPFTAGGGHCWLPDKEFSIGRHVFAVECDGDGLQTYVSRLIGEELTGEKPPWELRILPRCGPRRSEVAAVLRVHQALADGEGLVRVLCNALADSSVPRPKQSWRRGGLVWHWLSLLRALIACPASLLVWLALRTGDDNLLRPSSSRPAGNPSRTPTPVAWSAGIALSKVRRIQQVSRSSLNSVLLSAVAGATRVLLQGCGVRQPPDLKVALPVNLHHAMTKRSLSNKTMPVVVGLPVSVEGAVPRLWAARRCLQYLRSSADPVVVYIASLAGTFAGRLLSAMTDKATLQFASLLGPTSTALIGGCVLKAVYPVVSAPGRLGVSVTLFTYADQVFVTVTSDPALGPAGSLLLHHFNVQIEMLWRLLKHRRAPGEKEMRPHSMFAFRTADVRGSPVGELATRLCHVQEELERLGSLGDEESGSPDADPDGGGAGAGDTRLHCLKKEFSSLMAEVRRRKIRQQRLHRVPHQLPGRHRKRSIDRQSPESGRRRKRAVSFSVPQRHNMSLTGFLGGSRSGSGDHTHSDSILYSPTSSPEHPSASTSVQMPDDDEDWRAERMVRASFERAARLSHTKLDPILQAYFKSVTLEAAAGSYPCRCQHPSAPGSESETPDELTPSIVDEKSHRSRSFPDEQYEAIAEVYYPSTMKNVGKFDDEEVHADSNEPRRPSCLKRSSRSSPPSDESSPSLSTSVLRQLRCYYDDSYLSNRSPEEDSPALPEEPEVEHTRTYFFSSSSDVTSRFCDPSLHYISPIRETEVVIEASEPETEPEPEVEDGVNQIHISFTCKDADQLKFVDADSDPNTPGSLLATPKSGSSMLCPPAVQLTIVEEMETTETTIDNLHPRHSLTSTTSASTRYRSKRNSSCDNGYYEQESVDEKDKEKDIYSRSISLSNDMVSLDSVINLTSSSTTPSPACQDNGVDLLSQTPETSIDKTAICLSDTGEVCIFLGEDNHNAVRPNSLVIQKNYSE